MIAQPIAMLVVSGNGSNVIEGLNPEAYNISVIDDPGKAMEMLRDSEYDLVVLDDLVFGSDVVGVVREIRRRFPLTPVLVMSENKDSGYQTDLMEAGATDFLSEDLYREELHRRIRLVLQQRRQNRALARRNHNLQTLTSLVRRLHTATDVQTLIAETIDLACQTFGLYGMAIVINDGEMLNIYAGRAGASPDTLHTSSMRPHAYDPFKRVIQSNFVQTFGNIQSDSYYTMIPTLPKVESAIVIPLAYPEYTYGALAVFGNPGQPLNPDDLVIYELFAAQFTTAMQNAQLYEEQERRVQASSHLLRAWQRFITLNSADDIAQNLRDLIEDIPSVSHCMVWLYEDEFGENVIVNAQQAEVADIFYDLHRKGLTGHLYEDLDDQLQVTLRLGRGQNNPLGPLFRALHGQELMLFPITDSARLAGGLIASPVGNRQFGMEDANLMKSLAHAAGQALVRNVLTAVMGEKGGRLEAILRSIYEGIFFVDHTGQVAFCNPQFTELTSISPSDVLNRESGILLDRLAHESRDADTVMAQLQDAIQSVLDNNNENENYTILEISLADPEREIHVEFSRIISTLNNEYLGWIGIIRDNSRLKSMFTTQISLLDLMSEQIRVPHAELRGLVTALLENHSRFGNRERARFLRQIEKSVENLGELWENFLDMYNLEVTGLVLDREETDLYEIVQRVLDDRLFADNRRQIRVESPARLPVVKVDEVRIERVMSNVLQNALSYSPRGAAINLKLEDHDTEVHIVVQDQGVGIPAERLDQLFDPFDRPEDSEINDPMGLGMYISRELVQRHGGRMWAESVLNKGTTITIALPTTQGSGIVAPPPARPEVVRSEPQAVAAAVSPRPDPRQTGISVQKRQPKAIMVVQGSSNLVKFLYNKLDEQGYEMLLYRSGEEALSDVKAIRLDMIVLDVNLADANSLDICERMRKRTEVPIVMLADEASEAEEVRALKQFGADAFITRPITEEQLMARVDVILKRVMDIPVRTREPLDLGDLYIDFARREVFLNNKPIELTRIEYDLLHTLAVNENQVLTHKQLLEKVWGPEYQAETQYLWVNVSRLRKKLEPSGDSPRYIQTQQGVGYVFRRP
ncbi:MAG: response regulator [Anaerolineae bacterium]|nr:response regulator [Anaerolineae bacterium]